jgi:hypothetical protein
MYKQIKIGSTGEINTNCIQKTVNGIKYYIPFDPANTDYQEYLEWVAEGNTAEAAD